MKVKLNKNNRYIIASRTLCLITYFIVLFLHNTGLYISLGMTLGFLFISFKSLGKFILKNLEKYMSTMFITSLFVGVVSFYTYREIPLNIFVNIMLVTAWFLCLLGFFSVIYCICWVQEQLENERQTNE